MKAAEPADVRIRPIASADLAAVGELCGQLGYPVAARELESRWSRLRKGERDAIFVAQIAGGTVAGWIHVAAEAGLTHPECAEIKGLVVDASVRGLGIGRRLIAAAEAWSSGRGLRRVRLRTRVTREAAQRFYEDRGYSRVKTQHVYEKELE